jgi:hypothetical protein
MAGARFVAKAEYLRVGVLTARHIVLAPAYRFTTMVAESFPLSESCFQKVTN